MKDKRFCCRCEEVLVNGFYFHNSEVGICNRCVTDLAIQLIKNEDKEVINTLDKHIGSKKGRVNIMDMNLFELIQYTFLTIIFFIASMAAVNVLLTAMGIYLFWRK